MANKGNNPSAKNPDKDLIKKSQAQKKQASEAMPIKGKETGVAPSKKQADSVVLRQAVRGKEVNPNGSREAKKKNEDDQTIFDRIRRFKQFLKEAAIEFRKISWPEKSQIVRETWSVLFLVAVITAMVLGFDWALGNVFFTPLEHWARLHGGGIGRG